MTVPAFIPSPSDPVAFTVAGLGIRWYAIFILSGIVAGLLLVRWLAVRRGLDPEFPLDLAPLLVISGIAGARLFYVLLQIDYFAAHPAEALNFRMGGLSIHGALIAAALMLWWVCRREGQAMMVWADLLVAGVALGQAIGRWGNWANQEAFGRPTTLPWGLEIDPSHRPAQYAEAATFHPTFLYESVFNLVNALLLVWIVLAIGRGRFQPGTALWCYLLTYGVGRLLIESMRTDSLFLGPLPAAYWVSAAAIVAGAVMLRRTVLVPPDN
jgi:phosphatidylglycerol---prolipoprotein diacylglyceryl transferase